MTSNRDYENQSPPPQPPNHHRQICLLIQEGREVLLVTSGAVGIGRQMLSKQARLSLSVRDVVSGSGWVRWIAFVCVGGGGIERGRERELTSVGVGAYKSMHGNKSVGRSPPSYQAANYHLNLIRPNPPLHRPKKGSGYDSACAAAGQLGLMSLYETLFSTRQVATSQVR